MNFKRFATLLILSFGLVALVVVAAAAHAVSAAPIDPNGPEIEPNDDFDTATYIKWDAYTKPVAFRSGAIDPAGDVDYYFFDAYLLDTLAVEWKQWGSPVNGVLSLYDADRNLLAEATCAGSGVCLQHVFSADGRYFLKVSNAAAAGGADYNYQFTFTYLGRTDANEPNDSFAAATPIVYGEVRTGVISPCEDVDYFAFDVAANDEIMIDYYYGNWQLFDPGQHVVAESSEYWESRFVYLPAGGRYTLRITPFDGICDWAGRIRVGLLGNTEPNDTLQRATPIAYGDRFYSLISTCADVDYYRFTARAGDEIEINSWGNWQVLDSGNHVIADQYVGDDFLALPAGGAYYLRFSAYEGCAGLSDYEFTLIFLGNNEPNDTPAQARPIAFGEQAGGIVRCDDVDYFTFAGRAGQEVKFERNPRWNYRMELLDAGQNLVADSTFDAEFLYGVLPATGTYYVKVFTDMACEWDLRASYGFRGHVLAQPLYISLNKGGTVGGVTFTAGDILRYSADTGRFEMFVDMSDLGLNGNLTALDFNDLCWRDDYRAIFLGFATRYNLPGAGLVWPQDLVYADLSATGNATTGSVHIATDGSDIGLTTSGERIDAVATSDSWCTQRFLISTTGQASVPSELGFLRQQNEDLIRLSLDGRFGPDTVGQWQPHIDGSTYGFGAANVTAAAAGWDAYRDGDSLWLVFDRQVTLGGITFAPGDIAECFDSFEYDGEAFQCDSVSKFFDASDAGLGSYRIDALEVGPKE